MRVESIDSEASAYARYRLVRAVLASAFASLIVLLLAAGFFAGYATPAAAAVQTAISLLICVPLFSLTATFFERLNGQVAAVIGFGVFAIALLGVLLAMLAALLSFFSIPGAPPSNPLVGAAVFVLALPPLWLAWDCVLYFGWLLANEGDARAVRGWRPKTWRFFSNLQRQLGLPAFVAAIRGGLFITLAYMIAALLNIGLLALPLLPTFVIPRNLDSLLRGDGLGLALGIVAFLLANLLGANRAAAAFADGMARRRYQKVRDWDDRKPILFLRNFTQDQRKAPVQTANGFLGWLTGIGRARTLDEILLEHASPYGPVIAIGDPNDPLPPLGAARIFVSHDDWRGVVSGLAASAQAIIMCPTSTEGVRWELDHLVSSGAQPRTIYLASAHLPPEETSRLFAAIAGEPITASSGVPVALFRDPRLGWRALFARATTVQSYTVAANKALQALFGVEGAPLQRGRRQRAATA
ncbi:MAG: hypothetical protein ABUS57_09795 [Pseudomonadota bacterium]